MYGQCLVVRDPDSWIWCCLKGVLDIVSASLLSVYVLAAVAERI